MQAALCVTAAPGRISQPPSPRLGGSLQAAGVHRRLGFCGAALHLWRDLVPDAWIVVLLLAGRPSDAPRCGPKLESVLHSAESIVPASARVGMWFSSGSKIGPSRRLLAALTFHGVPWLDRGSLHLGALPRSRLTARASQGKDRRRHGHSAPLSIQPCASAPSSFWLPGAGSRPSPGCQPQATRSSVARCSCSSASVRPPLRAGSL